MAVERSASEETVLVDGVPVNHQYSKSLDFELLLRKLITTSVDPGLRYGSALRPYSELAIARTFARLTGYHDTFCSCNSAFRQSAATGDRWCGHCPKCRFVALMLAPFMDRRELAAILGRDLFADPDQIDGFAALMSDDDKPFECVGERRESAAALRMLSTRPEWSETPVVAALADRARALVDDDDVAALLTPAAECPAPTTRWRPPCGGSWPGRHDPRRGVRPSGGRLGPGSRGLSLARLLHDRRVAVRYIDDHPEAAAARLDEDWVRATRSWRPTTSPGRRSTSCCVPPG